MCFPFSPRKRETHKQFDPHPFPGQSREFVLCLLVFFSRIRRFPKEPFLEATQGLFAVGALLESLVFAIYRRRTNVQQLTCNIDLSSSFYYLFFSFVLLELKPFVLKGKVPGKNYEKVPKSVKKCERSVKSYETVLPFSCCPLVFLWI